VQLSTAALRGFGQTPHGVQGSKRGIIMLLAMVCTRPARYGNT